VDRRRRLDTSVARHALSGCSNIYRRPQVKEAAHWRHPCSNVWIQAGCITRNQVHV
jgi:hypothetical protein